MNITSRIINILVLLAAIGAAVCAYLLFQKREQITKGRRMMAESVVKAVKKIDPAVKISAEDMSIKLPAENLKNPLNVLDKNVNKIFNQRKAIADTLAETTNMVNAMESSMPPDEKLEEKDLTSYQTSQAKREAAVATVTKKVEYYGKKNQAVSAGMKSIAAAVRESEIPDEQLRDNEKLAEGFGKFSQKAERYTVRATKFGSHIETVSDKFKFDKKPNTAVDNDEFEEELRLNLENVDTFIAEYEKIKEEREQLKQEVQKLTEELDAKEKALQKQISENKNLQKEIEIAKKEVKRLKKIIDPFSEDEDEKDGKQDEMDYTIFLRKLVAKITYVNTEYGFVMIDAGSKSTVQGPGLDGKIINKPAPLPPNALMTVTTSLDPAKAQYVARLQIVRVGTTSSIANILPTPGRALPKVGDLVFFSESDFAQMRAIRELAMKKDEEAAPAPVPVIEKKAEEKAEPAESSDEGETAAASKTESEEKDTKDSSSAKVDGKKSSAAEDEEDEEEE